YSPAEVIGKTNKVIVRASKANDFVTVFLCSIDIKTGDLVYCSGGHPPAIIKRKSGEIETLATSSPILGAFSDLEYSEERTVVERGDMLVLYTDGVIETRNTEGALVGIQRLTEIVAAPVSLPKMPQHIFKAISNFSGGKMNDDVALLIVALTDKKNT
ncbi:MAG: PP2C family protein-serine/threonine phosphatase, partial [Thermoleophilia bacterium]